MNTFVPGAIIGGVWLVEAQLGRGGMGSVYRCRNQHSERIRAAIKLLDPAYQHHVEARERFLREAEILYGVEHPNVVRVRNINIDASPPYMEMEYVQGNSLENLLANRGAMPADEAVRHLRGLVDALGMMHRRKIYHRDVKPDNLLVGADGVVKLVDFGLAVETGGRRITQQGQSHFGTVSYCPPEWMSGEGLEPGSWDLYALGVVFYEMLAGSVAFPAPQGEDPRRQMMLVMSDKQVIPHLDPGPEIHPALREVVRGLTLRERKGRLSDTKQIVAMLDAFDPAWVPKSERKESRPKTPVVLNQRPSPKPKVEAKQTPTSAPLTSSGTRAAVAVVPMMGCLGVGLLGLLGIGVVTMMGEQQSERAVEFEWPPVEEGMDVQLLVDGAAPPKTLTIGRHEVSWRVGRQCDDYLPGCITLTEPIVIEAGEGVQSLSLPIAAPRPVDATFQVTGSPLTLTVDGQQLAVSEDGRVEVAGLMPGRHVVLLQEASCDLSCTPPCEPCRQTEVALELPVGGLPRFLPVALETAEPTDAVEPTPGVVAQPKPVEEDPEPKPVSRPVSQRAYAAWMAKNPDWTKNKAKKANRAGSGYLRSFDPDGFGPVTRVPHGAAVAYCRSRGGLLPIDAEPRTWTGGPPSEWRSGGGARWRSSDGTTGAESKSSDVRKQTGFRCVR